MANVITQHTLAAKKGRGLFPQEGEGAGVRGWPDHRLHFGRFRGADAACRRSEQDGDYGRPQGDGPGPAPRAGTGHRRNWLRLRLEGTGTVFRRRHLREPGRPQRAQHDRDDHRPRPVAGGGRFDDFVEGDAGERRQQTAGPRQRHVQAHELERATAGGEVVGAQMPTHRAAGIGDAEQRGAGP